MTRPATAGALAAERSPRAARGDRGLSFVLMADDHLGHVHAFLGVARRLRAAGHAVAFLGPGGLAPVVEAEGFAYVRDQRLSPLIGPPCVRSAAATRATCRAAVRERAAAIVACADAHVRALSPDLMIFDPFLLCHAPAFLRLGVPCVSLSTKPLLTPDPIVPPYTSALIPRPDRGGERRVAAAWLGRRLAYAGYRARCLWSERTRGWSHRSLTLAVAAETDFPLRAEWATRPLSWDLRFRSVPELVLHAVELELPRRRPPTGPGGYLGPCVDLPDADAPGDAPAGDGPLVFCNLGTVPAQQGSAVRDGYRAILGVLRREPSWRCVLATGSADVLEDLREDARGLGERVRLHARVPRGAWLARADVVITHGGANAVKEAILARRPMLVIPRRADQPGMAARVAYHGLGLAATAIDVVELTATLRRLLAEPSFHGRLDAMAEHFRRYDRAKVCETMLERAARREVPLFEGGFAPAAPP